MRAAAIPNWRAATLPPAVGGAKTMLMATEQQLLFALAREHFRNEGCIVDAGCFLGGSTLPLALGLRENRAFKARPRRGVIHSYDLFTIEPWTIGIYFPEGTPLETSFEPDFPQNIAEVADLVEVHPGDVTAAALPAHPIEILFIDLAKHWTVNDYVVRAFFPKLVPGHSVVIQQDYLYQTWTGWLPVTMEYFADYFDIVDHTEQNSVAFLLRREIPREMLQRDVIQSLTRSEMRALADRAIARFAGPQQAILTQSRDQFQEMLAESGWSD